MGETRVKKTKKKVSQPSEETSKSISLKKLEKLSIHTDSSATTLVPSSSDASPSTKTCQGHEAPLSKHRDLGVDASYITVQATESKGMAVFAATRIPAGTLVLAETPLIRLTQSEEDAATAAAAAADDDDNNSDDNNEADLDRPPYPPALETHFSRLSKPDQKRYLSLFDSQKTGFSRVKSIYYSNCYNLSGANKSTQTSAGGSCIGITASRINHSCIPNVQFSFDETQNKMLFHAIKPIPRGRELTSNYDTVFSVRAHRQRRQTLYYGFRCGCDACEPGTRGFWNRSCERRKGMIEARNLVCSAERMWIRAHDGGGPAAVLARGADPDPVAALRRLEDALLKEGLLGLPLADVYRDLVRWSARLGNETDVRRWRERELAVCVVCLGPGAVRSMDLRCQLSLSG